MANKNYRAQLVWLLSLMVFALLILAGFSIAGALACQGGAERAVQGIGN